MGLFMSLLASSVKFYYEFWGHATTDNEPSVSSVERLSTLDVKVFFMLLLYSPC